MARLVLSAPATGSSGSTVAVRGHIEVTGDAPRIITGATGAQLLITRGGKVVGGSSSTGAAVPVPLRAGTTRPAQALPGSVTLTGCTVDTTPADLPPGDYELVGVLAYGGDPLNGVPDGVAGARTFALVSAPVPIRVR